MKTNINSTEANKVISVEQMRKSDAWTIANLVSSKELMKRAGEGIFKAMIEHNCKGPVAIVAGTGNNAGDGYVVALLAVERGIDCEIILAANKFSPDGQYYFDQCMEQDIPAKLYIGEGKLAPYPTCDNHTVQTFESAKPAFKRADSVPNNSNSKPLDLTKYNTIVDCLLGTGFSGKQIRENMADLISAINKSGTYSVKSADSQRNAKNAQDMNGQHNTGKAQNASKKRGAFVISADINSGLNGNTGDGDLFVVSDLTVSIGFFKYGHFKGKSSQAMKDKINYDIGIKLVED